MKLNEQEVCSLLQQVLLQHHMVGHEVHNDNIFCNSCTHGKEPALWRPRQSGEFGSSVHFNNFSPGFTVATLIRIDSAPGTPASSSDNTVRADRIRSAVVYGG